MKNSNQRIRASFKSDFVTGGKVASDTRLRLLNPARTDSIARQTDSNQAEHSFSPLGSSSRPDPQFQGINSAGKRKNPSYEDDNSHDNAVREADAQSPRCERSGHSVTVTIKTATTGAYLRYTLDRSTPTGGPSGHGTKIAAASGKVTFPIGHKTLKAIAYKAGSTTSLIAVGDYDYEPGGGQ